MSQRLHNCVNNTNLDTIQCDAYACKLQRRGKSDNKMVGQPKVVRERSSSRNRITAQNSLLPSPKNRSIAGRTVHSEQLKSNPTTASVIHKELYTDNSALVEVTVKAHNAKQRSRSNSRVRNREPWGKLLRSQTSYENLSSFHNFDPLRTLHFLAKELHNKLIDSLPNDKNLQQMVIDMQHALSRVPPEVASTMILHGISENFARKASSSDVRQSKVKSCVSKENVTPVPEKIIHIVKAPVVEKGCQTIRCTYAENERLQKHLEESSAKIETACRQMEAVCTRLKSEKEELEIMLRAERETVKFLRKQVEDVENEKTESTSTTILNLRQEKETLQSQVKKLKAQVESQQGPSAESLKSLIQDLRKQKTDADDQNAVLNHQLTLLNMEKEKYVAILSARDRQIKEIRSEMNQLQDVVNEQLLELQNAPCSVPSSSSNIIGDQSSWSHLKSKGMCKIDDIDNSTPSSINTNESTLQQLFLREKIALSSFKELPSGDTSGRSTIINDSFKQGAVKGKKDGPKITSLQKDKSSPNILETNTHTNIRDMFAEIKKQALLVTGPAELQKSNDVDVCKNEKSAKK